jgi:hypothetical protein
VQNRIHQLCLVRVHDQCRRWLRRAAPATLLCVEQVGLEGKLVLSCRSFRGSFPLALGDHAGYLYKCYRCIMCFCTQILIQMNLQLVSQVFCSWVMGFVVDIAVGGMSIKVLAPATIILLRILKYYEQLQLLTCMYLVEPLFVRQSPKVSPFSLLSTLAVLPHNTCTKLFCHYPNSYYSCTSLPKLCTAKTTITCVLIRHGLLLRGCSRGT